MRLQHLAHPERLNLDDRIGTEAFVNPSTGEDYRQWRKGDILCAHNLWISNTVPTQKWHFLTVVYPAQPGEPVAAIERLDDFTVRVADEVISFNPNSPYARDADFVVDVPAIRPK